MVQPIARRSPSVLSGERRFRGRRAPGRRTGVQGLLAAPIQDDLHRRVALESPSEEVVEVLPIR